MKQIWINLKHFFATFNYFKWAKRLGILLAILCVLGLSGWFIFRGKILDYAWNKAVNKLKDKGYTLTGSNKSFTGIFDVSLQDVLLFNSKDTLASVQHVTIGISIWKSIWNGPTLSDLEIDNSRIHLIRTPEYCNFCGLSEKNTTKEKSDKPFLQRAFDLLKRSINKVPGKLIIKDFALTFRDSSDTLGLQIPDLSYKNKDFHGTVAFIEENHKTGFILSGKLDRSGLTGRLNLKPQTGKWAELPVLRRKFNLSAGFESADFALQEMDMDGGVLHLIAEGDFTGITVDDRRLADTNVVIQKCSGKLVANLSKDFIEIDSATSLSLNKIQTYLYASANLGNDKSYTLKFKSKKIKANDFFSSLPEGMFRNLKGLQATGELEYSMFMHLEDKAPQDVVFNSEMTPYNFKITKMGATDLAKMNGSFMHTFYEHGVPVRSFIVGPSNGSFTSLDAIPETLQKAVMTGEDPMFYGHSGFYAEAIRQSIAQNYVQKRFARGGSTISMQLVKNVFLSRKKTLARKAEEILIVWLIESQHLTSKARMFEVYLNIIEWGPGVFGIGEASSFYFAKGPSQLEPLECAFLASIVPMPKSYQYFLDSEGYVSPRDWNFVAIRNNMIKNGAIDEADTASFNVKITGPAANYLIKSEEEMPPLEDDLLIPGLLLKKKE